MLLRLGSRTLRDLNLMSPAGTTTPDSLYLPSRLASCTVCACTERPYGVIRHAALSLLQCQLASCGNICQRNRWLHDENAGTGRHQERREVLEDLRLRRHLHRLQRMSLRTCAAAGSWVLRLCSIAGSTYTRACQLPT